MFEKVKESVLVMLGAEDPKDPGWNRISSVTVNRDGTINVQMDAIKD